MRTSSLIQASKSYYAVKVARATSAVRAHWIGRAARRVHLTFTFGSVAGIPLKVHLNWFLTVGLVTWSLAAGYFPQEYPGWGPRLYWAISLVTAFLFFFSVLLHELGHAMVAVREKVPVKSITLFIFGGVAHIANEPETPGAEFRIVAAGPLTSLFLAGLFHVISLVRGLGPQVNGAAVYLSWINLILAVFNLIPGFPLDGGRILRSILWKLSSNFQKATRWASHLGLGIAISFILLGVGIMVIGQFLSGLWVAFIGWYLSTAVQEGYRQAADEEAAEAAEQAPGRWVGQSGKAASPQALPGLQIRLRQPPLAYSPIRPTAVPSPRVIPGAPADRDDGDRPF